MSEKCWAIGCAQELWYSIYVCPGHRHGYGGWGLRPAQELFVVLGGAYDFTTATQSSDFLCGPNPDAVLDVADSAATFRHDFCAESGTVV